MKTTSRFPVHTLFYGLVKISKRWPIIFIPFAGIPFQANTNINILGSSFESSKQFSPQKFIPVTVAITVEVSLMAEAINVLIKWQQCTKDQEEMFYHQTETNYRNNNYNNNTQMQMNCRAMKIK